MDFNSWVVGVFNGIAITFILIAVFETVGEEAIRKNVEKTIDEKMKKLL